MIRFARFAVIVLIAAPAIVRAAALEDGFSAAGRALHAVNPAAFSNGDTVDQLLQLLDDSDQNVRAQAAKALRPYAAADRKVQDRLAGIMEAGGEDLFVRKEAIKSLSIAASRSDEFRGRMIAAARETSNPDMVRSIACKALYSTLDPANPALDTRDALLALLLETNERPAVRAGAAWGLFPGAALNARTQDALLYAANDQWLDADARAEALRSLYFALDGRRTIRESVRSLADEALTPMPTRFAAVILFQRVNQDSSVGDWLEALARHASPMQIRTAAVLAQTEVMTEDLARYFHFTTFEGRALDPLVNE
jgi:HEAT repeat protein